MGGESKNPPLEPGETQAERNCKVFFEIPMRKLDLIGEHEFIDNTHYFNVPQVADLELSWYHCKLDGQMPMAALQLAVNKDDTAERSYSRLTWMSGKGWNYSMMGVEDERHISKRGEDLLHAVNQMLGTDYVAGVEYPIKESRVTEIVEFHAQVFLAVKGLTK